MALGVSGEGRKRSANWEMGWVADNGTGLVTKYSASGKILPTVITIPPTLSDTANPTGIVVNDSKAFRLQNGRQSEFLVATEDGTIAAWGANESGECNVPTPNGGFVSAAAGARHSLGLRGDGSAVGWGENGYGECSPPAPNSGFVAIAAGEKFSLGLKTDGSVVGWGLNHLGQYTVPAPNADFVAIAAGRIHGLGLKRDGSVVAWGWYPEAPEPNTGFRAIAAGAQSSGLLGSVNVAVSPQVFLYALAIAVGLALVATIVPAWYVGRVRPAEVLRNE